MIAFVAAVSPSVGVLGAAAAYVGIGAAVGATLRRRGVEPATAWSALAVWPLLLPVLAGPGAPAVVAGPLAARITDGFTALERAAALPGTTDPSWREELAGLRAALCAADGRLALVDHLLAETPADADPETLREAAALREARARAAAEVLDVLASLERLRLQIGMLLLAGEGARVGDTLRALHARAAASTEIAWVGARAGGGPRGG